MWLLLFGGVEVGLQITSLYKKYLPSIFHSVFPGVLCKINLAQSQNILLNVKNYLFGGVYQY